MQSTKVHGILEVAGTLDVNQFWPIGSSDADTTKLLVKVEPDSFRFRARTWAAPKTTRAFRDAIVHGKVRRPAIDAKGRVTVRLQGIDAPELHYRPAAVISPRRRTAEQHEAYLAWNHDYRQHVAERATLALRGLVASKGATTIPCRVRTAVGGPGDAFDTYGRLVGDVEIRAGRQWRNVNHWLVEQGWCVPGLYASMSTEEITTLVDLAREAKRRRRGVWPTFSGDASRFDWALRFRGRGVEPAADAGPLVLPKLFRRLSTWAVNKRAKMVRGSLLEYLQSKSDGCYEARVFLRQGPTSSTHRHFSEFVTPKGQVEAGPEDVVFQEDPSELKTATGQVIEQW